MFSCSATRIAELTTKKIIGQGTNLRGVILNLVAKLPLEMIETPPDTESGYSKARRTNPIRVAELEVKMEIRGSESFGTELLMITLTPRENCKLSKEEVKELVEHLATKFSATETWCDPFLIVENTTRNL